MHFQGDRSFGKARYRRRRRICQAGLALERRDLDTAEQLIERVLSIAERRRPVFEFLALLDRAVIWSARGHVHEALATVNVARLALPEAGSALLARADELERRSPTASRAACCWPGSRSPSATTTPPSNICRHWPGKA